MRFTLKKKLRDKKIIVGFILNYYAPAIVETFGMAGADYFILDNEHGCFSETEMENMVRAADSVGISTIVRVDYDNSSIQKALDMGAEGVQIPKINTRSDAERAVMLAKYPPDGERGVGLSARAVRVSETKGAAYLRLANENVLVIAQIETPAAIENIREIITTPGIDVAFLGKMDLSTAVGTPGDTTSPIMTELIEKFFSATSETGIVSGYIYDGKKPLADRREQNALYITTVVNCMGNIGEILKERDALEHHTPEKYAK